MRILVVEDERKLAAFLKKGLGQEGFVVDVAANGEEALEKMRDDPCDLVLLDVNLPGRDGFSVLKRLRHDGFRMPVLMLTARESVDDKVLALEAGANDYLTKPFAFRELVARLRAHLRPSPSSGDSLTVGDLTLDLKTRRALRAGTDIHLTNKEMSLLEILLRHAGEPVSRARLWEKAWENALELDSNVLDVHVARLRRKIDEGRLPRLIQTVHGTGYKIDSK